MTRNTYISRVAHWDWRLPPADRRNSEIKTYYLSPEELERYRKGGEKKVEEAKNYQTEKQEQPTEGPKRRRLRRPRAKARVNIIGMAFHGVLNYSYKEGEFAIRQPNKEGGVILDFNDIDNLIEELKTVRDKIREVSG